MDSSPRSFATVAWILSILPAQRGMQPLHHFGTRPFRLSRPAYLAGHLLLTRRILYLNCRDFIIKSKICQRFYTIFLVLFTKHCVS